MLRKDDRRVEHQVVDVVHEWHAGAPAGGVEVRDRRRHGQAKGDDDVVEGNARQRRGQLVLEQDRGLDPPRRGSRGSASRGTGARRRSGRRRRRGRGRRAASAGAGLRDRRRRRVAWQSSPAAPRPRAGALRRGRPCPRASGGSRRRAGPGAPSRARAPACRTSARQRSPRSAAFPAAKTVAFSPSLHQLAGPARHRREDREAGREGLEQRDAEGLVPDRREDEEPTRRVGLGEAATRPRAGEADVPGEAACGDLAPSGRSAYGRRVAPDDRQGHVLARGAEARDRLDRRVHALLLVEPADVEPAAEIARRSARGTGSGPRRGPRGSISCVSSASRRGRLASG